MDDRMMLKLPCSSTRLPHRGHVLAVDDTAASLDGRIANMGEPEGSRGHFMRKDNV
jgi:hypothetical protein